MLPPLLPVAEADGRVLRPRDLVSACSEKGAIFYQAGAGGREPAKGDAVRYVPLSAS